MNFGVAGAAIATVTGQIIGSIVPLIYFILMKNHLLWFTKFKLNIYALKRVIVNGLAGFISNASASVLGIVFNLQIMSLIGSDGVVAYGVVMYVNYIATGIFNGYSTGVAPIFSYHLGARNSKEIHSVFRKSLFIIGCCSFGLTFLVIILAQLLATLFVSYDASLMTLTTSAIRLYSISFLLCGYNIFVVAYFAAINQGITSSILSIIRTLLFQILSVIILPIIIGNNGIWLSAIIAEICALIVTLIAILKTHSIC
ncbi:MAG: hypothetical protein LUG12_08280 [Erysipelotrichaceae bacterium]|nr:hypothetical protein [Erysipelotrichaceae bacterium]